MRADAATREPGADAPALVIDVGSETDRSAVYHMRHRVYAAELGQHPTNDAARLTDALDETNQYLVARHGDEVVGFVSITPPGRRYSIDKYLQRATLPFPVDDGLYEVRLLTVEEAWRGTLLASLLMYAALRWIEDAGGTRIVAIGRTDLLDLYRKAGLEPLGRRVRSGAVEFELMTAPVEACREAAEGRFASVLERLRQGVVWSLPLPFAAPSSCAHGGAFFEAIGEGFETLERRSGIVAADVLDAWFPPAPGVIDTLQEHLPWILRTSPPTHAEGLVRTIARCRGVPAAAVVPGAGSSDLIFRALRHWVRAEDRVLVLDPLYGEYAHVLGRLIGCAVDRLELEEAAGFDLDPARLVAALRPEHAMVVLANPNSPTGRYTPRRTLQAALRDLPATTRAWVDETYVDYVGGSEASLERLAATSPNVTVCKSMSKVYALSGVRVGYLVTRPDEAASLRREGPPWAVGLPAQIAAVRALEDPAYYERRYRETADLRRRLAAGLRMLGLRVVDGQANFLLCRLPEDGPTAEALLAACRGRGVFLREVQSISPRLGPRVFRVAVRDGRTNARVLSTIADALR